MKMIDKKFLIEYVNNYIEECLDFEKLLEESEQTAATCYHQSRGERYAMKTLLLQFEKGVFDIEGEDDEHVTKEN